MQDQYIASFLFLVVGSVLPWFYLASKSFPSCSMFIVPALFLAIGIGLMEWRLLLGLVGFALCFCLWIYGFHLSEKWYAKHFPVFKTSPIETVTRRDGFRHDLHIAKVKAGFIIGIRYETEIDLTPMTIQTKWKDIFPDYPSAKRELLKRLEEFIPVDQRPWQGLPK